MPYVGLRGRWGWVCEGCVAGMGEDREAAAVPYVGLRGLSGRWGWVC